MCNNGIFQVEENNMKLEDVLRYSKIQSSIDSAVSSVLSNYAGKVSKYIICIGEYTSFSVLLWMTTPAKQHPNPYTIKYDFDMNDVSIDFPYNEDYTIAKDIVVALSIIDYKSTAEQQETNQE